MPEVIIKDDNGNTRKVDGDKVRRVLNAEDKEKITKLCNAYWTPEKFGKHSELQSTFADLVNKHLIGDCEDFIEALNKSKFELKPKGKKVLKNLLEEAGLDDYLEKSFITDALNVQGGDPQIGRGEFLFAAIFSNIGFSKDSGDLVELETNKKIELKGTTSVIGNGHNNDYKKMKDDLMWSVFKMLEGGKQIEHSFPSLSDESATAIKKLAGIDEKKLKKVFTALQNLDNENEGIARNAVKLYLDKKNLLRTVAAMHFYIYLNMERANYLLLLNDDYYSLFKTPTTLEEAYEIVLAVNIHQWKKGNAGISVTLN